MEAHLVVAALEPQLNKSNQVDKPSDRDFRDALTRADGAIKGKDTEALQWNRWSP